jgi:hypothetical protein
MRNVKTRHKVQRTTSLFLALRLDTSFSQANFVSYLKLSINFKCGLSSFYSQLGFSPEIKMGKSEDEYDEIWPLPAPGPASKKKTAAPTTVKQPKPKKETTTTTTSRNRKMTAAPKKTEKVVEVGECSDEEEWGGRQPPPLLSSKPPKGKKEVKRDSSEEEEEDRDRDRKRKIMDGSMSPGVGLQINSVLNQLGDELHHRFMAKRKRIQDCFVG